jgi:Xaa-Pro aminopeptidase
MKDYFPTGFFVGNRDSVLKATDARLIVLTANGLLQRSADTTFPFRQDSNFWYLTGVDEPDFVLVHGEDQTFLIAPHRSEHRDLWDGAIDKKALRRQSGIDTILEHHEGWTLLDKLLKKHKKVHTIAPAQTYFDDFGFYTNPSRSVLLGMLQKHRKLEIVDVRKQIARLRQIKQPCEIAVLQSAIDITTKSLAEVRKKLNRYAYEYEVSADVTAGFIRRGAAGHAYQPIIAAGAHGATIHYVDNSASIQPDDLLLFDIGAEVAGYSADISRTYAVGTATPRQRAVHAAVLKVRQAALDLLKPGTDMRQYEKDVDAIMAVELKKLGLLSDIEDRKKLKKYYPHLTSHFLGLDTHDAADYESPLAPGMVLTVEPGIYIPEEGIGIRVEDDVLVTEDGIEVLSASLPVDLE